MEYRYEPKGVCSYEMIIDIDGDTIKKVTIEGGCAGNTVGVSRLVEGMKIDEAIKRLKDDNNNVTLLLVGKGKYEQRLLKLIKKLNSVIEHIFNIFEYESSY